MSTVSKEWNGTNIKIINKPTRAELVINGRTVDFIEGGHVVEGKTDYMHGYDGENHIEVRFKQETSFWLIGYKLYAYFYYNGRLVYETELGD